VALRHQTLAAHDFIIHGEPKASTALREQISQKLGWHAVIPVDQQILELA
jgi:hypothetical protein